MRKCFAAGAGRPPAVRAECVRIPRASAFAENHFGPAQARAAPPLPQKNARALSYLYFFLISSQKDLCFGKDSLPSAPKSFSACF